MSESPQQSQELAPLPIEPIAGLPERFQPKSLTELMSWAKLVYSSGLAPKDMNEAGIVLAVQMGAELNISPAQALSGICVINGRATVWGDLGKAIFMRDAAYETFEDRDPAEARKRGEGWCKITMKDGREVERIFTREMATEAKAYERAKGYGPWATAEGSMLQWRAVWRAMKDADPRPFKGLTSREEAEDIKDLGRATIKPPARTDGVDSKAVDSFVKDVGKPVPAAPTRPAPSTPKRNDTAPPAKNGEEYTGTIKGLASFDTKKKNTDGSFFQRYELTMGDGTVFKTIKSEVVDTIKQIGKGNAAISFVKNQYGNEIVTLEPVPEQGKQEDLGG